MSGVLAGWDAAADPGAGYYALGHIVVAGVGAPRHHAPILDHQLDELIRELQST